MTAPLREQFVNNASSTLASGINNSVTSLAVASGTPFPSTGNFRLICEGEVMLCTARSGTTLTVVRGYEGTTAASHSSGVTISHILTADSFDRGGKDNVPLWGSDAPPLNLLVANDGQTVLTSADFGWTNQGGATLTDHNGSLTLRCPNNNGIAWRIAKLAAPSPPYTLIAALQFFVPRDTSGSGNVQAGIILRQASTGKFYDFSVNSQSLTPQRYGANKWTDVNTFSATPFALANPCFMGSVVWLKVEDDNTNLKFSLGFDGIEFVQLYSEARGTFVTGGPDEIGIGINNNTTYSADGLLRLLHWSTR
jgi:hypothetical protein